MEVNGMEEYEVIYKKMYLSLFQSVTTALEVMEEQNYGQAKDILKEGQQKAEELYMEAED